MKISAQELFKILSFKPQNNFKETIYQIANSLTQIGFEIEHIEFEEEKYANFVVGFVAECEKHPNSTKLSVCKVNNGREVIQVLCGAPNVRKGLKVVLANQGAVVPKNGFTITKTKLAGYESQGMICSASEMGSETDDGTIIELPSEVETGTSYAHYIGKNDAILDISITPNRGDALSYYGIAREISAKGFGSLPNITENQKTLPNNFTVNLSENLVHSAFFGTFKGYKLIPTAEILAKCGIPATKFPIVNYLNLVTELHGQPMHLYDASKIEGNITVRLSNEGEKLITISGDEITLQSGDIVVADDKKILSLAGIIGDARSAITNETQNFVLESCAFNRNHIFQTIRKYSIHTAASFRFERYIDNGTPQFSPQFSSAQKFVNEIGSAFEKTFTTLNAQSSNIVTFTPTQIKNILGFEVPKAEILKILHRLCFSCTEKNDEITAIVPSWRHFDVSQVYDISEEILRFIGIENCQKATLPAQNSNTSNTIRKAKNFIARNYHEIICLPFVSAKDFSFFGNISNAIRLANPIDIEKPCLRSSLIPSILHNISQCEKHSQYSSAIFEISKVFYKHSEKLLEHNEICIAKHGYSSIANPIHNQRKYNIFDIKEDTINILTTVFGINGESLSFQNASHDALHPHQNFNILLGKTVIAQIAQLHPLTLEEYEIKMPVFIGIINMQNLPPIKAVKKNEYKPFSLPSVHRSLSILIDEQTQCETILNAIKKIANKRFKANISEIFTNEEMKNTGKKSLLINIEIHQEQTLNSTEIEVQVLEVVNILTSTFNASIRC